MQKSEIRKISAQDERVETGPVQFGDDWPGLFIRGDDCLALFFYLSKVEASGDDAIAIYQVKEVLAELLYSPLQHPPLGEPTKIPYDIPKDCTQWRTPQIMERPQTDALAEMAR
jgi:hypothetical protein